MEDKGLYDALLVKYLAGELDEEGTVIIESHISSDEKTWRDIEALKSTWEILKVKESLDLVDLDLEWIELKKKLESEKAKVISLQKREHVEEQSYESALENKNSLRRTIRAAAVAASIIFVVFLGVKLFFGNPGETKQTATTEKVQPVPTDLIRHEVNLFDNPKVLLLDDGSTIVLYRNSVVSFKKVFPDNKRDIVLEGEARFTVAHDDSRPFTVFSGDITTTDIGTRFTINAFRNENNIVVTLDEGKVVVSPTDKGNPGFKEDVFLKPGQELTYNKASKVVKVRTLSARNKKGKSNGVAVEEKKDHPDIPKNYRGSWFMFNNQPLTDIFQSLEEMYHTKIIYSEKDVRKLYFIGRFNKLDSLGAILKQIGELNNLSVTRSDSTFIIRRNK